MTKRIPIWVWIICIEFLVMQYLICVNVYMMGDDYMYGTFGHERVFAPVFQYYFTGNGRWLINILDSLCLFFDRYLFIIVNPWLLLLLGFLLYHLISMLSGNKNPIVLAASLISISVISVLMTCEVFYWITGAMNYLVPALFLLASMIAAIKIRSGSLDKKRHFLCAILCLVSCMTMEQFGLMTIGWMFLVWGYDLIKTKKIKKTSIVVFLGSFLGLASIVFAPANLVRFSDAAAKGSSLITKVIDLFYYDYYSKVSATHIFIIAAYCGYRYFCEKKTKLSVISIVNALILLFLFDYKVLELRGGIVLLIASVSILMSLITIVPYFVSRFKREDSIYICALFIIEIGSQVMLLKTDLWGFRTSFSWILLYLIILGTLLSDRSDIQNFAVYSCVSCIAINPYIGMAGALLLIVMQLKNKTIPTLAVITSLLVIVVGLSDEVLGYKNNSPIHEQNIITAESANQYVEIEIQDYINERYGWNSPPFSDFHESYFRNYYHISSDVLIRYVE